MVAVDPLASLAIQDIFVTIGGKEYLLEGRPAADWLECLISGDLVSILPGWLGQEAEDLILDLLADDVIEVEELDDATRDVISAAAGRPWWWAIQLIRYAALDVHTWSRINGRLVLAGVNVSVVSLSAWVDAVYAIHVEHMEAGDEYTKFKAAIDTPPTPDLLDEAAEAEAFLSMLE